MAVNLSFIGGAGWQFFDDAGNPLSGGKIYTYAAGTTTPLVTYTSRTGLVANSNPIILDAAGRTPEQIWSTSGLLYKYVVANSNDVVIRTWDNIGEPIAVNAADLASTTDNTKGDALIGFKQSNSSGFLAGAVGKTVNDKLQESVSVKDFGAIGNGIANDTAAFNTAMTYAASQTYKPDIFIPAGIYKLDPITVPTGVTLVGVPYSNAGLNRDFTYLDFSSLTLNQKAITVKEAVCLINLSIQGPGKNIPGTYGIYTGATRVEADNNGYGTDLNIINCRAEGFDTGAIITRWINRINKCTFRENNRNLHIGETSNDTQVWQCFFGGPSTAGNVNVYINAQAGNGIGITDGIFEPSATGIQILGGDRILIDNNYFEICNAGFITNEGTGRTIVSNNFMLDFGANASGTSRYGVRCLKGHTTIENNTIFGYDAGTNTGLRYAIQITGGYTSDFKGVHIGFNSLGGVNKLPDFILDAEIRARITTPFNIKHDFIIQPGATPDVAGSVFNIPSGESEFDCVGFFRQIKWYVATTLDADITDIQIGRNAAVNITNDYVLGFSILTTDVKGDGYILQNADYNTNGKTFALGDLNRAISCFRTTTATTGAAIITFDIGLVRFTNLNT